MIFSIATFSLNFTLSLYRFQTSPSKRWRVIALLLPITKNLYRKKTDQKNMFFFPFPPTPTCLFHKQHTMFVHIDRVAVFKPLGLKLELITCRDFRSILHLLNWQLTNLPDNISVSIPLAVEWAGIIQTGFCLWLAKHMIFVLAQTRLGVRNCVCEDQKVTPMQGNNTVSIHNL